MRCVVFARPHREPEQTLNDPPRGLSLHLPASGGENEEAVIGKLVRMLCSQDYPDERYEVWVIDDNSINKVLLEQLRREYTN